MESDHKETLRKIRKVLEDYNLKEGGETPPSSESEEFIYKHTDFTYSICYYKNNQNKFQPYYKLSKDLLVLAMFSFRTNKAKELQKLYIAKFNQMEKELAWYKARYLGIVTRNNFTDSIRDYYIMERNNKNPYILFTDLIYLTLYGKNTNTIKVENNIVGENLRHWLRDEDIKLVDVLEQEIGTLISYGLTYAQIENMIKSKYKNNPKKELTLLKEKRI